MSSFLTTNRCTRTRIKTKDNIILQAFSLFYDHPAMVNEEAWHLFTHGNTKVMVDKDTLEIMRELECEYGFSPKNDTIITCKLTSRIVDDDERKKQMNQKYEYAKKIRTSIEKFFDGDKIAELTSTIDDMSLTGICDQDSDDNGLGKESTHANQA
jgi:hypothetical protein